MQDVDQNTLLIVLIGLVLTLYFGGKIVVRSGNFHVSNKTNVDCLEQSRENNSSRAETVDFHVCNVGVLICFRNFFVKDSKTSSNRKLPNNETLQE